MQVEITELNSILLIVYPVYPPTELDIANFEERHEHDIEVRQHAKRHLRGGRARVVLDLRLMECDEDLLTLLVAICKYTRDAEGWLGLVGNESLARVLAEYDLDEIFHCLDSREDALSRAAAWKPGGAW